jgi:hypothetical protein
MIDESATRTSLGVADPNGWKRAALLFDKVWFPADAVPNSPPPPPQVRFSLPAAEAELDAISHQLTLDWVTGRHETRGFDPRRPRDGIRIHQWAIANTYARHGFAAFPLYTSMDDFRDSTLEGDALFYQATLANINFAAENQMPWEQVLEFRKDDASLRKYRDFRRWIRDGLTASSLAEATDRIADRLEEYDQALAKHEVQTVKGSVAIVCQAAGIATAGALPQVVELTGHPLLGLAAAGLKLGFDTYVKIRELQLNRRMVDTEALEIAYVYDLRTTFGT